MGNRTNALSRMALDDVPCGIDNHLALTERPSLRFAGGAHGEDMHFIPIVIDHRFETVAHSLEEFVVEMGDKDAFLHTGAEIEQKR